MTPPLEHDYIGLSKSPDKLSAAGALNLKDTELRLGLPGSESPERVDGGGVGLTLGLSKSFVSGAKRGFSDAIDGTGEWGLPGVKGSEVETGKGAFPAKGENAGGKHLGQASTEKNDDGAAKAAPSAKAQVVGWPPIRSYRRNTMAANPSKNKEDLEGKQGSECLYIKVSMDGAPYLRKVDLKTYSNYKELSSALEKMFTCFTIGQCGSHGMTGKDILTEGRVMDLLQGSEYVLTYEDKDGDWMLVGDVPWDMFTDSCRRMRIMKGSDAIGIGMWLYHFLVLFMFA
ncbi:auxin-responsive protein IAA21-like [Canna indica]|uniref:Auxin-responsive protein n=1 Tax=Canna indica TaxID=4628 RepID=A0AAQ3QMB6_9LILI|nr:auxin-responsive protein IAA21-like [Canna indica]